MKIRDLKQQLEQAMDGYRSAVAKNFHQSAEKEKIANIVINNMDDIIAALELAGGTLTAAVYTTTPAVVPREDGGVTLTGDASEAEERAEEKAEDAVDGKKMKKHGFGKE